MLAAQQSVVFGRVAPLRARSARRVQAVATQARADARPLWLPGSEAPAHLNGTLPGDYGFDPLNLGEEKKALDWYVQAELVHCRFAMLGAAGILIPDILTHIGALKVPAWYVAGAVPISFMNTGTLIATTFILMGWAEHKRLYDIKSPGSQGAKGSFLGFEAALAGSGEVGYPGGAFDPLQLSKTKEFKKYKVNEIANGRTAMLAMLGFFSQSQTNATPIDNLLAHLADPWHTTFVNNPVALPRILGF